VSCDAHLASEGQDCLWVSRAQIESEPKSVSSGQKFCKKKSNKAASIKYRKKKAAEKEFLFAECREYERRNAELRKNIEDIQPKISLIKSLLIETLIART